ncbi:hypothetical protein GCM10007973_02330 [Polymorphobacter multimanifer]|nr:hypothetical protein GCM10007973_02330 [Polymorphobacter multimanifer]
MPQICSNTGEKILTPFWIATSEQVTERTTIEQGNPALPAMCRSIMREMAALAKRREIVRSVVPGVLIQMGGGQHHI